MNFVRAARHRVAGIFLLIAILVIAGAFEMTRLPASIFPSVTFPTVKVIADVGEEPADRMMPTATRPLEEAILRVPGIDVVRSITSRGSSELDAQFAWGTDMQLALQRVEAETQRVRPDLPPETNIDVQWMNPAVFPIEGYALISDKESLAELNQLAEFTLKPALVRIPGVSEIQIQGGLDREFQVHLDPRALEPRHLPVADVVDAIRKSNDIISAGLTEQNHELYLTLVNGRVHSVDELAHLAVSVPNERPVSLGELGTITVANATSYVRTTAHGHPAVLVNIIRQPSANTVSIAAAVNRLFKDQPKLLPRDVRWLNFYDQAEFVQDSVNGTRDAILIGVALAALVLLLFLQKWRLTVIAVIAIPITVAVVGLLLGVFGQTINLMTLAGVAASLGLIADDAIVVVENIEHHASAAPRDGATSDTEHTTRASETSIREMLPALVNTSLSTTVILLPFALLSGVVGAFFKPLALTMAVTLVVSFLFALFVVPVCVAVFGKVTAQRSEERPVAEQAPAGWRQWTRSARDRADRVYRATVAAFLASGFFAVVTVAAMVIVAYVLYARIGTDFLPHMDEGSIIMDYFTPPGTSLAETDAMLREAEKVIMAVPDVSTYSRRTGTQLGFFITEPNTGDYVIKLKPKGQRRDVETVIEDLRTKIAAVEPAIDTDFGQLLEDNIGDLTGGSPQPIDVKIFGDDPAALQAKAKTVADIVGKIPGVTDVFNGLTIAGPALTVDVDPLAAAQMGLTTQDVHDALEPSIAGTVAGQVQVSDRIYDLRVFAPHIDSLGAVLIRAKTPADAVLPVAAVARVSTGEPEVEIDRENLKTYFGITARLENRDLGSAMGDVRQAVATKAQLNPDQSVEYGGLYEQQQQSFRGLLYVLLSGLVLVAVVVLFEFADWRAPIVTALCAISVLAGVLAALILTGQTLNISSYVGAIMMVGIVGENAIFVIHEAKLGLERGLNVTDAWAQAAHRRLRPVAMTILATAFALAPLAIAIGAGAQLMQPLAIAVIGGFVLSGPIVLLVLPGLYRMLDPQGRLGRRLGT